MTAVIGWKNIEIVKKKRTDWRSFDTTDITDTQSSLQRELWLADQPRSAMSYSFKARSNHLANKLGTNLWARVSHLISNPTLPNEKQCKYSFPLRINLARMKIVRTTEAQWPVPDLPQLTRDLYWMHLYSFRTWREFFDLDLWLLTWELTYFDRLKRLKTWLENCLDKTCDLQDLAFELNFSWQTWTFTNLDNTGLQRIQKDLTLDSDLFDWLGLGHRGETSTN